MAFNRSFLDYILPIIHLVESRNTSNQAPLRLASAGYPDLLLRNSDIVSSIPDSLSSFVVNNSAALRWHNLESNHYSYFSFEKFIQSRGWVFNYFDIDQGTGACSDRFIYLDLNDPISNELYSSFDILIDSGTAEHCFNIGQVFENYYHLLKPGGVLLQYIPFLSPNHGFWSANPTLIHDLSLCNPIKLLKLSIECYPTYKDYFNCTPSFLDFHPTSRFLLNPDIVNGVSLMLFVYKKTAKSMFKFPIQTKYIKK